MKILYPKVYSILRKGNDPTTVKWGEESIKGENAYLYFLGPEDLNFDIDILNLFYPVGGSDDFKLFSYYRIPAEYSKDGQEHVVKNQKEFFEYFKENPKSLE